MIDLWAVIKQCNQEVEYNFFADVRRHCVNEYLFKYSLLLTIKTSEVLYLQDSCIEVLMSEQLRQQKFSCRKSFNQRTITWQRENSFL